MGKIKSALELALEKTADFQVDKNALNEKEAKDFGRKLASRFFSEKGLNPGEELKKYDKVFRPSATRGYTEILMTYIKLPSVPADIDSLDNIVEGFASLNSEEKNVRELFDQIKQFFAQYLEQTNSLRDNLAQQYLPVLKQKEEAYYKQTGQKMELQPEQDPEFVRALEQHSAQLRGQYMEVIKQAKEQLLAYLL